MPASMPDDFLTSIPSITHTCDGCSPGGRTATIRTAAKEATGQLYVYTPYSHTRFTGTAAPAPWSCRGTDCRFLSLSVSVYGMLKLLILENTLKIFSLGIEHFSLSLTGDNQINVIFHGPVEVTGTVAILHPGVMVSLELCFAFLRDT